MANTPRVENTVPQQGGHPRKGVAALFASALQLQFNIVTVFATFTDPAFICTK